MPFNRRREGTRVAFRPSPDFDVLTSLWVNIVPSDTGAILTLQYDYPDFTPMVGWKVEASAATYVISAVDGRALTCTL